MGQGRNLYVLLRNLKDYIDIAQDDDSDAVLLAGFCLTASRMWEGSTQRAFCPQYETRYYDLPESDDMLKLDADLLEVVTFTTQNAGETVSSDDYFLMCGASHNWQPYDRITMKSDGNRPNLLYSGTPQKSQAVTGYWGYHENWANAWQDSNDALAADATASTTTLTVGNADGDDIYSIAPRFKAGQLLRIVTGSDTEYIYLVSVDTADDELTVIRGVNGTTAVAHSSGDQIDVFVPMGEVAQAVTRLAAWLYGQKDAPFTQRIQAAVGGTTIEIPESAPVDVRAMAAIYKRVGL